MPAIVPDAMAEQSGIVLPMSDAEEFDPDADYGDHACRKYMYEPIFIPKTSPHIYWGLRDGFYRSAVTLTQITINKNLLGDFEGIAALFLFRHYLELSLKLAIYEGRWLKSSNENASASERAKNTHNLEGLWSMAKRDAAPKIDPNYWAELDIDFLDRCIAEFHRLDPNNVSFRYPENEITGYDVNYPRLRFNMEHVHDILEKIISWLGVTYDQNQEWQAILESF